MTGVPWTVDAETVSLTVGSCAACGFRFFPVHDYGCESCGETGRQISVRAIPASGTVTTVVMVHTHPELPTPFRVGEVALDAENVVVQALTDLDVAAGDRVIGRIDDEAQRFMFAPPAKGN